MLLIRRLVYFPGYVAAMHDLVTRLARYRELVKELSIRSITDRHSGELLGSFWIFIQPIVLMLVYLFLFVFVFKIRFPEGSGMNVSYTAYLLSGLMAWLVFQDSLTRAPTALSRFAAVMKQVNLPNEVFVVVHCAQSALMLIVHLALLVLCLTVINGTVFWTYALIPVLFVAQLACMLGLTFLIAPISLVIKDLRDLLPVMAFVLTFLMPIFYPEGLLPDWVMNLFYLNPFTYFILCYQDVFAFGTVREPLIWLGMLVISFSTFVLGYRFHRMMRDFTS